MIESNSNMHINEVDNKNAYKRGIGLVLLLFGIIGIIFISYNILYLFINSVKDPSKLPMIGILISYSQIDGEIILLGEKFKLPVSFYYVMGVFLLLFSLRIVESLTRALLKIGAGLIDGNLIVSHSRVRSDIKKLKKITDKFLNPWPKYCRRAQA